MTFCCLLQARRQRTLVYFRLFTFIGNQLLKHSEIDHYLCMKQTLEDMLGGGTCDYHGGLQGPRPRRIRPRPAAFRAFFPHLGPGPWPPPASDVMMTPRTSSSMTL